MIKFIWTLLTLLILTLPKTSFAHSQTQIIEMTSNGFEPESVTVDVNSTIIFVNKDTESRWPASNVHPTHELYSEFDPKKPILPGESWPFNPKRAGEWRYHDHLFPHIRGVITVIDENTNIKNDSKKNDSNFTNDVKTILNNIWTQIKKMFSFNIKSNKQIKILDANEFFKLTSDEQINTIKDIAENEGVEKAWKYLKDTFKGQGGSSGNIHDLTHLVGSLSFKEKGFNGLIICSAEFAFGCYHGFLDNAFAKSLDSLLDAEKACMQLGKGNSITGPQASCIHGIGHGVASFYSTNDIKSSLKTCRKLISGKEYCFDGVFMEFARNAKDTFFKKEDPLYPCNQLEKEFGYAYSFACGRNQPSLLMGRFNIGFAEIVSICLTSDSKPFKQACFDSLGFSLASQENVEQVIIGCQKIGVSEFVSRCLKSAAGEMVFQEVPNWTDKSQALCNADLESRDACLSHVDRIISEYGRQRKINFSPLKNNEDLNTYIRNQLKTCYETDGRDGCYKKAADVLYSQFGLSNTLSLLKVNESYPEVYARCHEVTHYLSRNEYEKQKSIAKVYAQCDSTCHGGCYHGTLEAYLKEQEAKTNYDINAEFPKTCGKENNYQKPLEFYECLHGLGHAAMFVTDMELMQSLKLCDTLNDQIYKEKCFTGVFMENSSSSTSFDHKSIYIKADDPFFPCNILDEKYQPLCWQYQSSYFSIITHQDWVKIAQMCSQIPKQYQDRCVRTIGTNQVGFTSSLQTMKEDCNLMPNLQFKNVCVEGVIASLSYRFVGNTQKMIDFCSIVNIDDKESCFRQIGASIIDWNKDPKVAIKECNKIPDPQGVSWCASELQ